MVDQLAGDLFISTIRTKATMVHAKLGIGAENSGKLVARVKKAAKDIALQTGKEYLLVDGTPGIGCPVVSSLSGADMVLVVTEPTVSGIHDLKRIFELAQKFSIPTACIINKVDLNEEVTGQIEQVAMQQGISILGRIRYDRQFTRSMLEGKTIVESSSTQSADALKDCWEEIKRFAAGVQRDGTA
jgi:MinD superfamily P-loop ATPase